ncbi:hypothetical protein EGH21_19610 [Halomicroarcula sp. F13]|uniref:Uncharacterized protein n=1 Tax=Haloarcula rubra TaxID=2487747 RepID=A0AAW4PYG9_9EURY|nr:hypothetical protein [Halomicroarcula rubra]MBX0325237.1 hypothetical protein [Halomicroarcula rubra]
MTCGRTAFVVGIVLVALCTGTAVADAPSGLDSTCQDRPNTVVLFVEHHDRAHTDGATLYPGTVVYVAYCGDGEAESPTAGGQTVWGIGADAGLDNVTREGDTYRAVIPENKESVVLNVDTIRNQSPQNEITVTVQQGPTVQSTLTGTQLSFRSERATSYAANESKYLSARNETRMAADALNQTAQNIRKAGPSAFANEHASTANASLAKLNTSQATADDRAAALQSLLYVRATESTLPHGDHGQALEALHDSERTTTERTAAALDTYRGALRSVERAARQTIITNMAAGLLTGLVIGAIGGGYRLRQYGQKTQDFSDFRGSDFDRSLLTAPVALGLALVVGGLALLIVTGIGGALL